jgi:transcriptional regulator with XRE-family HTH domain
MLTVGSRLQLERFRRGISQTELARRSGIAQANLSHIENGKQDITVSTLLQICLALDVKPSSVFENPVANRKSPRFTGLRLEKIAAAVVGPRLPKSKNDREIVLLLRKSMLPGRRPRISSKEAILRWAELRQQLTTEEIETLRQRVEDALQRTAKKTREETLGEILRREKSDRGF